MNYFIKNIKVNKLLHLQDLNIPIANEQTPHLILTGKNGTGKTILLNAIADFLETVRTDKGLEFLKIENYIENSRRFVKNATTDAERLNQQNNLQYWEDRYAKIFSAVNIEFNDIYNIAKLIQDDDFIFAFYIANRKPQMLEPKNPTKPNLQQKHKVSETATNQFLFFLSDLKIQEALARNEKQTVDADNINQWFVEFEKLLKDIYQDEHLKLVFNYKDYSFLIHTKEKSFKFTQMSDGFSAALDIIADLIMKMQSDKSLTRSYQKRGIVLIDEIETHLHLELQRIIMPLLSRIFPNIQFIVTTHSPFVLSSMPNAIAYDLEHREIIDELTEYSYESLAEGYFGVKTDSSYMEMRLNELQSLLGKSDLENGDAAKIRQLVADFNNIPEAVSPLIKGVFNQLLITYSEKIKSLE